MTSAIFFVAPRLAALVSLCCVLLGCGGAPSGGVSPQTGGRGGDGGSVGSGGGVGAHGAGGAVAGGGATGGGATGGSATGGSSGSGGTAHAMEPFEPVTNVHGRMDVEITRGRVTPLKAVRIDGDYRGRTTLSGDLLIVALAYGTPRWVQTVADPRKVHEQVQDDAVGVLSEQFPGEFMATKEALSNSDFEFYTTSPTTPLETKVVLENLDVLKQGTTLVGTVHGSDLVPFLYP